MNYMQKNYTKIDNIENRLYVEELYRERLYKIELYKDKIILYKKKTI